MVDFLTELFDQFDDEEQARIRAAEDSVEGILAQGAALVRDRQLAAGSTVLTAWVLEPQDDARADAAGVVFDAYVNALWRQSDPRRSESIQEFNATVEELVVPVLTRYGREGRDLIDWRRGQCRANASLVHSLLQSSNANSQSSMIGSPARSPQDATDGASGHTDESDTTGQAQTERDQSGAAEVPAISGPPWEILGFSEPWGKRRRRYAERNSECTRRRENWHDAEGVENLLKSARGWAKPVLRGLVSEVQDVFDLKQRVTQQSFDKFIVRDTYFWKRYRDFESALWEEGRPSLEDHAIGAMAERVTAAAKAQSSNERQPGQALDPLANKGSGTSSGTAHQSRLDKIEEILKPHYAEIRDKDVRLPALCECESDADRAALAEGLRGRASVWATEALLAVLTNPGLPPIEPALFDSMISKLVVRLAKDAADFFSLDNYVWFEEPRANNCKPQGVNFPKYRSHILARLMEDLPKIAKDPSNTNRTRYLGDPMIQGTIPDLAQWRRQQKDIAIQKARDILNSRPGWEQSQLALTQAEEDFDKSSHLDPWQRALNYYRAIGEAWLEIVSDNETLQAFYTILPIIMEGVYLKCFGTTTEAFRATSSLARQFEEGLRDGDKDLRKRAAARAIAAMSARKTNRRSGKKARVTEIESVKQEIRELKRAKFSHKEICDRLGDKPRPRHAAWRHLRWSAALKDPAYKSSVKSWLSRV